MSTRPLRVDFYRDADKKWRWNAHRQYLPRHILSDSGEGYSRRIDAIAAMCAVVGIDAVIWIDECEDKAKKFGQASRSGGLVKVYVWKLRVDS